MSLRLRLVVALLGLLLAGLGVYGVASYQAFARAAMDRLDADLRAALPVLERELARQVGMPGRGGRPGGPHGGGGPVVIAPGTYAELRDPHGAVLASIQAVASDVQPDLSFLDDADLGELHTVPSRAGPGSWRALRTPAPGGLTVVSAVPTATVDQALGRLLRIQLVAGAALLGALAGGAWLVLRASLRPLENMAVTARSITAGTLDQRVLEPSSATEIGQLADALNHMLDELEVSFDEREQTEARLRRFVSDASHELRTPLTSIQGYAELLRIAGDDEQVNHDLVVGRIESEAGRMGRLVADLLALARLDEHVPSPDGHAPSPDEHLPRPDELVDLAVLAAETCADAHAADPSRPLHLEAAGPVTVRGDTHLLRQALGNLVANAQRHTPAATPIEVHVGVQGSHARITVRDHGHGLSAEGLAHAFERFWQADGSRGAAGSGLGLAIVDSIVARHGGQVGVANAADGGAVFTVSLPHDPRPDRGTP